MDSGLLKGRARYNLLFSAHRTAPNTLSDETSTQAQSPVIPICLSQSHYLLYVDATCVCDWPTAMWAEQRGDQRGPVQEADWAGRSGEARAGVHEKARVPAFPVTSEK